MHWIVIFLCNYCFAACFSLSLSLWNFPSFFFVENVMKFRMIILNIKIETLARQYEHIKEQCAHCFYVKCKVRKLCAATHSHTHTHAEHRKPRNSTAKRATRNIKKTIEKWMTDALKSFEKQCKRALPFKSEIYFVYIELGSMYSVLYTCTQSQLKWHYCQQEVPYLCLGFPQSSHLAHYTIYLTL